MLSPDGTIIHSQAGLLSQDGCCRALDAHGDGYVRGEGAGIVVLKPLSQVKKSDRVYALLRGIAVNHNGHNKRITAVSQTETVIGPVYTVEFVVGVVPSLRRRNEHIPA